MSLLYPEAWGRCGWTLLHACSFGVDDTLTREQRDGMYHLLWSLTDVLPCKKCQAHLRDELSVHFYNSNLPAFQTKANLTRSLNELHNSVNRALGKATMSYEEMCKMYKEPAHGMCVPSTGGRSTLEDTLAYFTLSATIAALIVWAGGRVLRCKMLGQCQP